jgi:uncharacterized protein YunC (DUF1805 family)
MANKNQSQVQSVGDFSAVFTHPLIAGGAAVSLVGFKVEGSIVDSDQLIDNSKVVALIGGLSVIITNNIKSGTLRWTGVRTSGDPAQGDLVAISQYLQDVGDNVGGNLRVSWGQNGVTKYVNFTPITVKRVKALVLAGNDVPDYAIEWEYGSFTTG